MKLDGKKFSEMCISAANALNNDQAVINALNVFPVPDGDTGVNMSLTMSTLQQLTNFDGTVSDCATKVADYMLRAARGNSGAILSLFFRGFAKAVKGLNEVDADIINSSRKKRIASGAGTTVEEVNKLLKQYEQTNKLMKQMTSGKKFGKFGKMPF